VKERRSKTFCALQPWIGKSSAVLSKRYPDHSAPKTRKRREKSGGEKRGGKLDSGMVIRDGLDTLLSLGIPFIELIVGLMLKEEEELWV
jgi:hypothetical protein